MIETPQRTYYDGVQASRYARGKAQVEETQGNLWTERNWWRRGVFLLLGLLGLAVSGLIWVGTRPRYEPMYLTVNTDGQLQVLTWDLYDPSLADLKRDLILWLRCVRGIPLDKPTLERCWQIVPMYLLKGTQAYRTVGEYFKQLKPGESLFQKTIDVRNVKALREPDGRWRMEWEEDISSIPKSGGLGKLEQTARHTAILIVSRVKPSKNDEVFLHGEPINPHGLRVIALAWGD